MSSAVLPPIAQLTFEDRGPIVIVASYILIIHTLLFAVVKICSTLVLKRSFDWDDALIACAGVLGLAQTVVLERASINGIGRFQDSLDEDQLNVCFKRFYASNVLSLFVQALAKASVVFLINRLSASTSKKWKFSLINGAILAWLVFSIFALSFQCSLPNPWFYRPSRCASRGALWYPILVFNLLIDAVISVVFGPTIWKLQITRLAKIRIVLMFASRFLVCGLIIAQIITLAPALKASDTTRAMMLPTVVGQFVMSFSVLTAMIPSLYRFVSQLYTGPGFGGMLDRTQYQMYNWSHDKKDSKDKDKRSVTGPDANKVKQTNFRPDVGGRSYNVTINDDRPSLDRVSKTSGNGSEDMIIKQTTAWTVTSYQMGAS